MLQFFVPDRKPIGFAGADGHFEGSLGCSELDLFASSRVMSLELLHFSQSEELHVFSSPDVRNVFLLLFLFLHDLRQRDLESWKIYDRFENRLLRMIYIHCHL